MNRQRLQHLWTLISSKRLFAALAAVLVLISLTSASALIAFAEEADAQEDPVLAETSADTTSAVVGRTTTDTPVHSATTATFEVLVTVDGATLERNVLSGTVGDVLTLMGVTVGENDLLSVESGTVIDKDLAVTISRVTYKTYTQTETIAYSTVTKNDNTMLSGTTKVTQTGKNGEKEVTYRETYVDGVLTETAVIETTVLTEAVNKIVAKGTRRPVSTTITVGGDIRLDLDSNGQPIDYKALYTGKATAYTAAPGKGTASGRKAQVGVVAVDPKVIPYGTELYIVSPDGKWVYGYAVAGDTGGALKSGKVVVDVFYDTVAECYKFGRRTMNVYVIG